MSLFRSAMAALVRRAKNSSENKAPAGRQRSRLFLDTLVPRFKPEKKLEAHPPEPEPKPQPKPLPKLRPRPRLWAGLMSPFPRFGKKDEE